VPFPEVVRAFSISPGPLSLFMMEGVSLGDAAIAGAVDSMKSSKKANDCLSWQCRKD